MTTTPPAAGGHATVAVEVDGVSKTYGATKALQEVSLRITEGEIHGLVGRNGAGKSTLIRCITGLEEPDTGTIRFFGDDAPPISAPEQWKQLVETVHQRAAMVDTMTVAENIFINRYPTGPGRTISWGRMRAAARDLLDEWGIDQNPSQLLGDVPVEARGMIQIARVLSAGTRIILLDEPTVQLDGHATSRLFEHVIDLKKRGVTFVFVSHFLHEIEEVCDSATVLRDGRTLWTKPATEISRRDLVAAVLAGHETQTARIANAAPGADAKPALETKGLTDRHGAFRNVDISVAPGELLAIAGLGGSGKTEFGEAVAGLRPTSAGTVIINGTRLQTGSVVRAQDAGLAHVPADRHRSGYVPQLNVEENMTMSISQQFSRRGFISLRERRRRAVQLIDEVSLVPPRPSLAVESLSGGNQQKVVFARAMATDPSVLVLISPTAGVDISAKDVIYTLIAQAVQRGLAVVLVSDDVEEILVSDRVLVMFRGEIVADLTSPEESEIVRAIEGMQEAS